MEKEMKKFALVEKAFQKIKTATVKFYNIIIGS